MEGHAGTAVRGNRSSPPALRDPADHGESRGLVDPGVMNPVIDVERLGSRPRPSSHNLAPRNRNHRVQPSAGSEPE